MSFYNDAERWSRTVDLIINRVTIINQTLDSGYSGYGSGPCTVTYRRGTYVLSVCGSSFATWRVWDVETASDALTKVDSLADGLWLLMRSGRLSYSQNVNQHATI